MNTYPKPKLRPEQKTMAILATVVLIAANGCLGQMSSTNGNPWIMKVMKESVTNTLAAAKHHAFEAKDRAVSPMQNSPADVAPKLDALAKLHTQRKVVGKNSLN